MNATGMKALRSSDGSVLMEYLVLLVFVGAILVVASNTLFGGYGSGGFSFGPLGQQVQGFYQRTMGGLSLPIP